MYCIISPQKPLFFSCVWPIKNWSHYFLYGKAPGRPFCLNRNISKMKSLAGKWTQTGSQLVFLGSVKIKLMINHHETISGFTSLQAY